MGSASVSARGSTVVMLASAVAVFLAALDQTVVATALPSLAEEFGSLDVMPWVVSAYLLTATTATPVTGRLIDRHGARRVFAFSLGLFLLGSVGCGFAPTAWTLVFARAVQGLGGGALGTAGLTLVSELAGPERLGRYQSYFGLLFGFASVAGPPLGGAIAATIGWRWIFHLNVVLGVVLLLLVWRRHQAPEPTGARVNQASTAMLAVALGGLVALSIVGSSSDALVVLVLVAVCVSAVAGFLAIERRSSAPLLPLGVLATRGIGVLAAVGCLSAMGLFTLITYLPSMLQMAVARTPAEAGTLMIPFMAAVMVSSLWAGRQVDRHQNHWTFLASGTTMAAVSLLAISLSGAAAGWWLPVGASTLFGFGIGMVMQMTIVTAQKSAPAELVGTITGTVLLLRMVGSLLGVAALGGMLSSLIARGLSTVGSGLTPVEATDHRVLGALPDAVRAETIGVVGSSYQVIFGIGSVLLIAAAVLAWGRVRTLRAAAGSTSAAEQG